MQCGSWLMAILLVCVCGSAVDGQCWDDTDCTVLGSQEKIIECIWQCRSKQLIMNMEDMLANQERSTEEGEEEDSLSLLLSALAPSDATDIQVDGMRPQRSEDRPSYSMEHFRWGKPMGRKRRPVKVQANGSLDDGNEDQTLETPFPPPNRRQLDSIEEQGDNKKKNTKSGVKYRMTHFRWNVPPAVKRYGGFMKPWPKHSHKSLLTLLRNIIVKDGQ